MSNKCLKIWSNYEGDCEDISKVNLTENSSKEFFFECHPFEQTIENQLEYYNIFKTVKIFDSRAQGHGATDDYKFTNLDQFPEAEHISMKYGLDIQWTELRKVLICTTKKCEVIYLVIEQETKSNKYKIISMLLDPNAYFQEGDGSTMAFLHGDDLVIDNGGDVSSIVIISHRTIKTSEITADANEIAISAILKLLYKFNHNGKYADQQFGDLPIDKQHIFDKIDKLINIVRQNGEVDDFN